MIIHNKSKDPKVPSTLRLATEWTPTRDEKTGSIIPQGKLWGFTEMIAQSRREGKNRRDGATVSTRVLALADKIGKELFLNAAAGNAGIPGAEGPRKRRRKEILAKARL